MLQKLFNAFPNKTWFLRVCRISLLKTLWEKEKLLVTNDFSFPTVFSTHLDNSLPLSPKLKLSSANSFSLEESKISFGKGLKRLHPKHGPKNRHAKFLFPLGSNQVLVRCSSNARKCTFPSCRRHS